ncbi:acetyltransferase [Priestia endophytica]|uniref:acetyltransferase n=1 Tax=Priestia endophytica TaxID=135735 RepID=UPI003D295E1D
MKTCIKCNSELTKAHISGIQGEFEINKKPRGFFKDSPIYSKVSSYVCSECGYLEFYVEQPEKFK